MVMVLTVKYSDNIYFHQSDQSMVLIQIYDWKKKDMHLHVWLLKHMATGAKKLRAPSHSWPLA